MNPFFLQNVYYLLVAREVLQYRFQPADHVANGGPTFRLQKHVPDKLAFTRGYKTQVPDREARGSQVNVRNEAAGRRSTHEMFFDTYNISK